MSNKELIDEVIRIIENRYKHYPNPNWGRMNADACVLGELTCIVELLKNKKENLEDEKINLEDIDKNSLCWDDLYLEQKLEVLYNNFKRIIEGGIEK